MSPAHSAENPLRAEAANLQVQTLPLPIAENDHNISKYRPGQNALSSERKHAGTQIKTPRLNILFALSAITLPMLILPAILLALIFSNRVSQHSGLSPELALHLAPTPDDRNAYLVRLSSTRLITVATWISTVAPMLPTFIMILLSFPVARKISEGPRRRPGENLPTPFQVGVYLKLQNGSTSSLWDYFKYRFWPKREHLANSVSMAANGLLIMTLISYLIFAADTWLHIATSTVPFTILKPWSPSIIFNAYGRGINTTLCSPTGQYRDKSEIPSSNLGNSAAEKCSISVDHGNIYLTAEHDATLTLTNISTKHYIRSYTDNSSGFSWRAAGKENVFNFLTSADIDQKTDFQATSIGVTTTCAPISQKCKLYMDALGTSVSYKCSSGFAGNSSLTATARGGSRYSVESHYFFDANLSRPLVGNSRSNGADNATLSINPIYSAHVGFGGGLHTNSDIVASNGRNNAWILGCESTVVDMTFLWRNQVVTNVTYTPSNESLGGTIVRPMFLDLSTVALILVSLSASSSTPSNLADAMANAISREMIGLNVGIMEPRTNLQEQTREEFLVARVPVAPLYSLIALTLLYAIVGMVLAVVAFKSALGETKEVQARLTVAGVVAEAFEESERVRKRVRQVDDLFAERDGPGTSRRIGVVPAEEGGWRFELH